jgi:hypothetical protein
LGVYFLLFGTTYTTVTRRAIKAIKWVLEFIENSDVEKIARKYNIYG